MSHTAWNELCWGLFLLVWAAGWLASWIRGPRVRQRAASGDWLVGIGPAVVIRGLPPSAWRGLTFQSPWLGYPGIPLLAAATAFTLWARLRLGGMWPSRPAVREGHTLRTDGPYAVTRHPIYTGILGMIAGSALMAGLGWTLLAFVAALAAFWLKARAEERLMVDTFGQTYVEYRRRTPMLVPGWRRGHLRE